MGLLNTGCQKVFLGMLLPDPRRADKRLISLCLRHFRITGSKWTVCVHKKTDSHFPIEVCEYKNIACAQRFHERRCLSGVCCHHCGPSVSGGDS